MAHRKAKAGKPMALFGLKEAVKQPVDRMARLAEVSKYFGKQVRDCKRCKAINGICQPHHSFLVRLVDCEGPLFLQTFDER